ncbi:MAG: CHAT domain-containing protein [Saprospiraceae bacterium]
MLIIIVIGIASFLITPLTFGQTSPDVEINERLHTVDSLRRRDLYPAVKQQLSRLQELQGQMDTEQLAEYFKLSGDALFESAQYPEALDYFSKSKTELEKLNTPKSKLDYTNIFTLNGIVYKKMGEYEKAKDIFLEGIKYAQNLPTKDKNRAVKYLYNNLGESYEQLGRYDEAIKTNYLALELIAELGQEVSRGAGVAHNNLGISYKQLGRYRLAREHFEIAAKIYEKALGANSWSAIMAQESAAIALEDFGNSEKAIPLLINILEYHQSLAGSDLSAIARTHSTIGSYHMRVGNFSESIESYKRAIATLRSMNFYKRDLEFRILTRLADVESRSGNMTDARNHLNECFDIYSSAQPLALSDITTLLNIEAFYYSLNDQPDSLFLSIKKANQLSLKDPENQIRNIISIRPKYIQALIDQNLFTLAQIEIDSTAAFIKSNEERIFRLDIVLLKANLDALRAKLSCATGNIKQAFAERLDKKLEEHTKLLIDNTASASGKRNQRSSCTSCFNVGNVTEALANLHLQAYLKGEDTNGNHLQKALIALDVKQSYLTNIWQNEHFSGLPQKERRIAQEIRQRISGYDLLIFENDAGTLAAQKQNSLYLDSITVLRPQLAAYIDQLAPKPLNFNRTFEFSSLSSDQSMLLFHPEADSLHILFMHYGGIAHHRIKAGSKLRKKLNTYSQFCQSNNLGFGASLETLNLGASLYNDLIGWLPSELLNASSRIAIIESAPTENLPFAALLTKPVSSNAVGFRDLHFAAEKHAFSYHQSPSAFYESQQAKHYASGISITALAPSQLSSEPIASSTTGLSPTIGLEYATQEVESIVQKFNGTLLKGKQADFYGLLSAFNNSNIIHIASHASSNHTDGDFSYIVVTDTAMLSGERLYAKTLSDHELPADLVVLAACESGSGKLRNGEGTVNLSNVFLSAGTQSVLHTSWRVEDKRSQEVLLGFYDQLEQKQPLDQALVKAQRTYLQTAGGQYLHPFYWSSFGVSGNLSAIESTWSNWLYFAAPLGLLTLLFLYWKRK